MDFFTCILLLNLEKKIKKMQIEFSKRVEKILHVSLYWT